jgi:hypothetical protein
MPRDIGRFAGAGGVMPGGEGASRQDVIFVMAAPGLTLGPWFRGTVDSSWPEEIPA